MAERTLSGPDSPGIPAVQPCFGREGAAAATAFTSRVQPLEQRGLPATQETKPSRRVADFSICSILAPERSGAKPGGQEEAPGGTAERAGPLQGSAWTSRSRFKPPSFLPSKAGSACAACSSSPKRKQAGSPRPASCSPRVPFSAAQLRVLESSFQQTPYLSPGQVRDMALRLDLPENRVKIWFQNRRARERRDHLKQHTASELGVKGAPLQRQPPPAWR